MDITPDTLRTFVAAAHTLNFTQAAKQVNLTQSAVSIQVPAVTSITRLAASMVHTAGVSEAMATINAEVDVAVTVKGRSPKVLFAGGVKLMVWSAAAAVTSAETGNAGL